MQVAVEQLPNRMMALRPILSLKRPHGQAAMPTAKEDAAACCTIIISTFQLRETTFREDVPKVPFARKKVICAFFATCIAIKKLSMEACTKFI